MPFPQECSFLFVVNVLDISEASCQRDEWGVVMPPSTVAGYADEVPSPVFRWRNGRISQVEQHEHFYWHRNAWHQPGGIVAHYNPAYNSPVDVQPTVFDSHATFTVFRGWKFRPLVFMQADATVYDINPCVWEQSEPRA